MSVKPAVFAFDTETTGLDPGFNEIISLAGILYDSEFKEIGRLSLHAHPDYPERAHPKALEINGYTHEEWTKRGAMSQEELLKYLNNWLVKRYSYRVIPLGHNVKFDISHVQALYERFEFTDEWKKLFSYHCLDTVGVAMFFDMANFRKLGDRYNLGRLCERYNITLSNAHDALADIDATVKLFLKMVDLVGGDAAKLAASSPTSNRSSRLLVDREGDWFLNAGKHKDTLLDRVADEDPKYLRWMLDKVEELSDEQRTAIKEALKAARE